MQVELKSGLDDRRAEFCALYDGCAPWLYSYILSLLHRPDDTEEVLQETAKLLWEKFDCYHPDTEFRAWACRVAHFKVLKHREKKARRPVAFSDLLVEAIDEDAVALADRLDARTAALAGCLEKLSPRNRQVIRYRYAAQGSIEQVAQISRLLDARGLSHLVTHSRPSVPVCQPRAGRRRTRMSSAARDFHRLDTLVDRLADGSITVAEQEQLGQILSLAAARQRYLERMFLVGQLRWNERQRRGARGDATRPAVAQPDGHRVPRRGRQPFGGVARLAQGLGDDGRGRPGHVLRRFDGLDCHQPSIYRALGGKGPLRNTRELLQRKSWRALVHGGRTERIHRS